MTIRYLSVCSGIEAATAAVHPLGWVPVGFAEIEAFPSAVLAHRHGSNLPGEPLSRNAPPNFGDFTQIDPATIGPVDVLIGGTPCQAFSIAGKRQSLADARGNLTLAYVVLAHELARLNDGITAWWENVPGVLSTADNAFGCFLGALVGSDAPCVSPLERGRWPDIGMVAGPAGRAAWRVLDAQFFGLAQRRRRVFVVADLGGGADPAAVLFERQSLRGHPPARAEARQGAAADAARGAGNRRAFGGGRTGGPVEQAATLTANGGGQAMDFEVETFLVETAHPLLAKGNDSHASDLDTYVAHALRGEGFDASEDGTGRGTPLVPVAIPFDRTQITCAANFSKPKDGDPCHPLAATAPPPSVAYAIQERAVSENPAAGLDGMGVREGVAYTLGAREKVQAVAFDLRGREGGAQFEGPHDTANIRAASGGSSRSYLATQNGAPCRAGLHRSVEDGPSASALCGGAHGGERWAVRRLTPTECERLQGFPDGHTMIPWRGRPADQCPDGPRYKALGNSMAVNVMAWIGARLDAQLRKGRS